MPDGLDKNNLITEMGHEICFIRDEWRALKTKELLNKTIRHDLEVPQKPNINDDNEFWSSSSSFGPILNSRGISKLKKAIREEQTYKRNNISFYSGIIMGILGLIISILSIIKINGYI